MKLLNVFKKEIKTKWSTRLFILVLTLIVCTIYGSNVHLKHHYDLSKNTPKDRFKGFNKISEQSFNHIKIENSVYSEVHFDTSYQHCAGFYNYEKDMDKWANSVFVKNDTLFLNALDSYSNDYGRSFIKIFAPNIESVTLIKSSLTISSLHQKTLKVNVSDWSRFILGNNVSDLDSFKISMSRKSEIYSRDFSQNKNNIKIQVVEAELQDTCTLNLGRADIENFKLKASEGNKIELSSKTLARLMKNN